MPSISQFCVLGPACLEVFLSSIVTSKTLVRLFLVSFGFISELVRLDCVAPVGSSVTVEAARMGISRKVLIASNLKGEMLDCLDCVQLERGSNW